MSRWRIDPTRADAPWTGLVADGSEYLQALRSVLDHSGDALPDEVVLHLYAYELAERMREQLQARNAVAWQLPLWPESLFAAARIRVHGAVEIQDLYPTPSSVELREGSVEDIAAAQRRLLGGVLADPVAYRRHVHCLAEERGWPVVDSSLDPHPYAATASGLLSRDGRLLLEKRPDNARVTPGCWDSPGGHVEEGETTEETLRRELLEELGVVVRDFRLAGVRDVVEDPPGRLYRHYVYVVDGWEAEPTPMLGRPLIWMTPEEILTRHDVNPVITQVVGEISRRHWI